MEVANHLYHFLSLMNGEDMHTMIEDDTAAFSQFGSDQDSPLVMKIHRYSNTTCTSITNSDMLKSYCVFSEIMDPDSR